MIVKQVLGPEYSEWRVISFIRKNDSRKHMLFAALCYRNEPIISNQKTRRDNCSVARYYTVSGNYAHQYYCDIGIYPTDIV